MIRAPFFSANGALLRDSRPWKPVNVEEAFTELPSFGALFAVSAEFIEQRVRNPPEAQLLRSLAEAGRTLDVLLTKLLGLLRRMQRLRIHTHVVPSADKRMESMRASIAAVVGRITQKLRSMKKQCAALRIYSETNRNYSAELAAEVPHVALKKAALAEVEHRLDRRLQRLLSAARPPVLDDVSTAATFNSTECLASMASTSTGTSIPTAAHATARTTTSTSAPMTTSTTTATSTTAANSTTTSSSTTNPASKVSVRVPEITLSVASPSLSSCTVNSTTPTMQSAAVSEVPSRVLEGSSSAALVLGAKHSRLNDSASPSPPRKRLHSNTGQKREQQREQQQEKESEQQQQESEQQQGDEENGE
jgi:hypothetical protein